MFTKLQVNISHGHINRIVDIIVRISNYFDT